VADSGTHWTEGSREIWAIEGNCYINQGLTYARSKQAVVWLDRAAPSSLQPNRVTLYLSGDVTLDYQKGGTAPVQQAGALAARITDKQWHGELVSQKPVTVRIAAERLPSATKPAVYKEALAAKKTQIERLVKPLQYAEPIGPGTPVPSQQAVPPVGQRRLRLLPRSGMGFQPATATSTDPNELIVTVSNGVNIIVDGLAGFGSIDVETDRLVIWTQKPQAGGLSGEMLQDENVPLELYMEGNIVFRQGERIIYADRMYYDVRRRAGIILNAEVLTPVPAYEGLVRLRAQVLQQVGDGQFIAQNASLTSSRFCVPGYEFRSGALTYQDVQQPLVNPYTGTPETDATGQPLVRHEKLATASNNFLYVEEVPIFYWPTIATDLERPTYYIERLQFKSDTVFGMQVYSEFDAYQLFGIHKPPAGTEWKLDFDYLSERGFAAGTSFDYDRRESPSGPGYFGTFDAWGLHDSGKDNLGRDRRSLQPEEDFRGRIFGQHRHFLPDNLQLSIELGLISDRNFLEQYFEHEWDEFKDETTGFELKTINDNTSWSLAGDIQVNDFFTQTEGTRLDHFWLGEPLFGDALTWYEHSSVGYLKQDPTTVPQDPAEAAKFSYLPWEVESQGERLITRQEIDLPFAAGPVKIVPYALGEAGHWGEVLDQDDDQRLYGQIGVRASLPMWAVDPFAESQLFNVHGLAHKMVWEVDLSYSDANRNVEDFPLYDPLDDDNIEAFRRRFPFDVFGGPNPVPLRFDERNYAVRRGLGSWVTSPSYEVVDDLLAARFGLSQKWQTKRGAPENRHIVDWITLDTHATIFPDADRDNFGEELGMVDYDFHWFVGDRVTLLSSGYFEFYDDGPRYFTVGGYLNRPPRGSLYAGIHSLEGPISSNVLALAYAYRMSPKWISTFGTTFDLGDAENIGQNFSLTRIGESFLVSLGANVDASKGSFGVSLSIVPRFLPRGRFGAGGANLVIPPAGAFGLE
jgi:hypothetical protein